MAVNAESWLGGFHGGRRGHELERTGPGEHVPVTAGDNPHHHLDHRIGALHPVGKILARDLQNDQVIESAHGCRAWLVVDHRHFADHRTRTARPDLNHLTVAQHQDFDIAAFDNVGTFPAFTFADQNLALAEVLFGRAGHGFNTFRFILCYSCTGLSSPISCFC